MVARCAPQWLRSRVGRRVAIGPHKVILAEHPGLKSEIMRQNLNLAEDSPRLNRVPCQLAMLAFLDKAASSSVDV